MCARAAIATYDPDGILEVPRSRPYSQLSAGPLILHERHPRVHALACCNACERLHESSSQFGVQTPGCVELLHPHAKHVARANVPATEYNVCVDKQCITRERDAMLAASHVTHDTVFKVVFLVA